MESNSELSAKTEADFDPSLLNVLDLIKSKYDNILPYHKSDHTRKVLERAFLIGQILGLNERELNLLKIASLFHDFVSDFDIIEVRVEHQGKNLIVKKRSMRRVKNEEASAQEAERWMREKGYSENEIVLVKESILATIPAWDQEKGTVYQSRLNKNSHPVIRAFCLADIGAAGMSARDYLRDIFNLFLEDYPDFHQSILGERKLSDEEKDFYLNKFREFIKLQVNFIKGRRALFEGEIEGEGIDEEKKKKLRKLFSAFDESLKIINQEIDMFQNFDFENMVKRFNELTTDSR